MLKVFLWGMGLSCQIYLRICAGAVIQKYHKSLEGCERILSGADARSRNALVTFHTAVFPLVLSKIDVVSQPVIAGTNNICFELIYYLTHFLGEPDSQNHHIDVHGAGCDAMPRCHSSSVWFFLIEHRDTDTTIATDVDGDDRRALSLTLPLPTFPW